MMRVADRPQLQVLVLLLMADLCSSEMTTQFDNTPHTSPSPFTTTTPSSHPLHADDTDTPSTTVTPTFQPLHADNTDTTPITTVTTTSPYPLHAANTDTTPITTLTTSSSSSPHPVRADDTDTDTPITTTEALAAASESPHKGRDVSTQHRLRKRDAQQNTGEKTTVSRPKPALPSNSLPCPFHAPLHGFPFMPDGTRRNYTSEERMEKCVHRVSKVSLYDCYLQKNHPQGRVGQVDLCNCANATFTVLQYLHGNCLGSDHFKRVCYLGADFADMCAMTNRVALQVRKKGRQLHLLFNISTASDSDALSLKLVYFREGIITVKVGAELTWARDCITVTLPTGRLAVLSIKHFRKGQHQSGHDSLRLVAAECGQTGDKARRLSNFPVLFPHPGSAPNLSDHQNGDTHLPLLLSYRSDSSLTWRDNFTLMLSFFPISARPYRVGNQWNCSIAVWSDLHKHFPDCDLFGHCVEGEDEAGCPFTSATYGPGFIEAGESQVFLAEMDISGTSVPHAAVTTCQGHRARPVTLSSPRKWMHIVTALPSAGTFPRQTQFWLDLRPTLFTLTTNARDINVKSMYAETWQWGSGAVAYYLHPSLYQVSSVMRVIQVNKRLAAQVHTTIPDDWNLPAHSHQRPREKNIYPLMKYQLCEIPNHPKHRGNIVLDAMLNLTASRVPLVTCPTRHVTLAILACDQRSVCTGRVERRGLSYTVMCTSSLTQTTPYFTCRIAEQHVPYSVVCDWRQDCGDNSDEAFCRFPPCGHGSFDCGNGQCIHNRQMCDKRDDCTSLADERNCEGTSTFDVHFNVTTPPALVSFNRPGSFTVTPLPANTTQCPATHYQCPGDGYCLPVYTRCNGMMDCPGHEDEAGCDVYTCEGLYRCRGRDRTICLHWKHLCDGFVQCPLQDDELMCSERMEACPDQCVCYGMTMYRFDTVLYLRYLEGRGTGLTSDVIANHTMLIHLSVGACGWRNVSDMELINLHVLDLSDNLLQTVHFQHLEKLKNLRELVLAGNPLSTSLSSSSGRYKLLTLSLLNLSRVPDQFSNLRLFSDFMPWLQILDLSQSELTSLQGSSLFTYLTTLDVQGCPLSEFSPDFMKGMEKLHNVFGDNFKLCCSAMLPDAFTGKCAAPVDEISSCENLLKSGLFGILLAVFAFLALLGNLGSFAYRVALFSRGRNKVGFLVFVVHLCVSDFLMGVYLSILGVADRMYAGNYLWKEMTWRRSTVCHIAGFLSLMSCEVSSFLIFLITLDRFLVIRFPFSRLRFGTTSAQVACGVIWGLGVILASIPLLPVTSHWAFYSQTGICIPLPVTRADFPGRQYSFAVIIVVNFVMFLLIAVGQAFIYWSVKVNTLSKDVSKSKDDVIVKDKTRSKEFTIARRLLVIAMSDFLCWFPIGVCGLLAKLDIPVPGEVNAAMATLVLPVNAALNPFLYTYTLLQQKGRKEREARLQKFIVSQVKNQLSGGHL